jgi:L-lactate dehydrogenase complex protein LldG
MNDRDFILGQIRDALQKPARHSGGAASPAPSKASSPAPRDFVRCLPKVGVSWDERLSLFQNAALELKTDFILLDRLEDLPAQALRLRDSEGWKKVASHRGALTDAVCAGLNLPLLYTDQAYDKRELEPCDAGISECDALVAQTGSVLVSNRCAGGRALSVLPPHHVVLARRDQLIADLPAAFELITTKYAPNFPSMISFITGPSRTGDIERILVLGAHGPKKLTVICV